MPSPSAPTLRVVVRGSGSIGQRHARVFRQVGADVSLWPVRDRGLNADATDDATGARLLDNTTGPAALRDAFVVVATDTSRHVADALEALDAGAEMVLVEKPVAPTAAAARDLETHPRRSAVWVAAPLRAHEGFRHLRRLVGRLDRGGAAHVWSQSWLPDWRPDRDYRESYSARADEGGVLRDLVHEIDYATVLFGSPALLGASLATGGPLEIESEQAATLLWAGGLFDVTARLDYTTRPTTRGVVITSPDGTLEWDVARATVRHTTAAGDITEQVFEHDLDRDIVMGTQARAALELRPTSPLDERVARGAPATLSDGIDAVRLCDEARGVGTRDTATISTPEDAP
ncbi:putative dehydrogenase [Humibacillus xanthopallidus]|uniref:Putative dehydrogenase n=1 Tax=Humibacillus xanthopallidus TaxID=412689 RepID=A0A543PXB5_9MICO|nr:Gfo/Idh/MocA family oxidoreductase [Humibacillus xanthopallidus]TQN48681.1 putative dehydrogenase [Humibacillus xanthopallidus]